METKKLQFTLKELEDIRFALLMTSSEASLQNEPRLSQQLHALYEKVANYLEPYNC